MAATAIQGSLPQTSLAPSGFTLVSSQFEELPAGSGVSEASKKTLLRVRGLVPAELWNRFGSRVIPKLRSAKQLQARVELTVGVESSALAALEMEIQQVLADLDLVGKVSVEKDRE